jgi:hypothetical protein
MAKTPLPLTVDVQPFGPGADELSRIGRTLFAARAFRRAAGAGEYRLLGIEAVEADDRDQKSKAPRKPQRYRGTVHDRGRHRTLIVEGRLDKPTSFEISESGEQPPVTFDEFTEAAARVRAHQDYASDAAADSLAVYRPMPPEVGQQEPDGRRRRAIAVGTFSRHTGTSRDIVGVDVTDGRVIRFEGRGPSGSSPLNDSICGAPANAGQATASKGTAGQAWVTVKQGSQTLWRFLAVRPAASSGLRGSGVEVRYVDYRGRRVLYRAHVPILNVRYDNDACGPYRDWQWEEGQIQAAGTNVGSGFRLCSSPPQTIMDTGSDTGNFLGVGVYVDGQEVVLVSEMEAGWYRYVSQWRLHANGTIRPRFGFAATDSPCVCNVHHHHAYWRFDFDLVTPGGNRVLEFNDPPIIANKHWHEKHFEIARPRDPSHKRRWRVVHTRSGRAYDIVPGDHDGVATEQSDWPFGRGDVWVLRYHGTEIDDGFNSTTSPNADAKIDQWVNGESVFDQDVVIWYGAHFTHDVSHEDPAQHGHVVGPDLVPVKW